MKMGETVEVVRERERQFREQSSSKKRCHNSILCKHAELLDSLERAVLYSNKKKEENTLDKVNIIKRSYIIQKSNRHY